jgi:uncharacterized membrane protein
MEIQADSQSVQIKPIPNPAHVRQRFWQVWVPLVVGILVIVSLAVLATISTFGSSATGDQFASVSLIFLILLAIFPALFLLVILAALVYGLIKLLSILPTYTRKAQDFFSKAALFIRKASDWIIQPVLTIHGWQAAVKTLFKHFQVH